MFAFEIKEESDSKMEIEGEFSFHIISTHCQRLKTLKTIPSDQFNRPTIEVPPPTPYILHYSGTPRYNHPVYKLAHLVITAIFLQTKHKNH